MSTRGVIARKTGDGFVGRYHHWDSYPQGLGATLFEVRNGHFKRDTGAMLRYLLDEHPGGWSTINGADFTKPAGYQEPRIGTLVDGDDGPHCYCHGDRKEGEQVVTNLTAGAIGCEFAYVFDGDLMLVLSSENEDGGKMVGMFGSGNPDCTWVEMARVELNGEAPDWDQMVEDYGAKWMEQAKASVHNQRR